jgi:hypothetical protein
MLVIKSFKQDTKFQITYILTIILFLTTNKINSHNKNKPNSSNNNKILKMTKNN